MRWISNNDEYICQIKNIYTPNSKYEFEAGKLVALLEFIYFIRYKSHLQWNTSTQEKLILRDNFNVIHLCPECRFEA